MTSSSMAPATDADRFTDAERDALKEGDRVRVLHVYNQGDCDAIATLRGPFTDNGGARRVAVADFETRVFGSTQWYVDARDCRKLPAETPQPFSAANRPAPGQRVRVSRIAEVTDSCDLTGTVMDGRHIVYGRTFYTRVELDDEFDGGRQFDVLYTDMAPLPPAEEEPAPLQPFSRENRPQRGQQVRVSRIFNVENSCDYVGEVVDERLYERRDSFYVRVRMDRGYSCTNDLGVMLEDMMPIGAEPAAEETPAAPADDRMVSALDVRRTTMKRASEHGWCSDAERALREMDLEPEQKVSFRATVEVRVDAAIQACPWFETEEQLKAAVEDGDIHLDLVPDGDGRYAISVYSSRGRAPVSSFRFASGFQSCTTATLKEK